jgi:hypothetical protein
LKDEDGYDEKGKHNNQQMMEIEKVGSSMCTSTSSGSVCCVLMQVLVLIVMLFPTSHSIQVVALKSNKLNGFRQKSNICTD